MGLGSGKGRHLSLRPKLKLSVLVEILGRYGLSRDNLLGGFAIVAFELSSV